MAVLGADVDQLRSTAKQFTQAADRLQTSLKTLNTVVSNGAMWRGPDSDKFRSEWNAQSVGSLNAAISALREAADAMRRNAEQQENASRDEGESGNGSASRTYRTDSIRYEQAPTGLNGMWNELGEVPNSGDMSGYRVQKVVDEYGNERYIVYIGGTNGFFDHQSPQANVDAISGRPDAAQLEALRRLIPEGAEVMLVGYSQGGIDAQNIAAAGNLNVTQIVTYGSPVRNDLNIPATHLQYSQDIVPSASAIRPDLWSNSARSGNDNVEVFSEKASLFTVFGLGEHTGGYDGLSEKWDSAASSGADTRASDSAKNLTKFQGDVVDQVDIKRDGSATW